MSQKIEKYYYSYMKSIKSQFVKTNSVHDKGIFLLDHIMGSIMIIFIVIALKLAQTFVVMAKYKLNLLSGHQA
jgi:hypothetical protein